MPTQDQAEQEQLEDHFEPWNQSTTRLNRILFEVLEYQGIKLFDLDLVSRTEITTLFKVVASHISLDKVDQGVAFDYLCELRRELIALFHATLEIKEMELITEFRLYSAAAASLARSLAYHAEGKPLFRLPEYPTFDGDLDIYMDAVMEPYLAARVLWLEQRKAAGQELHPIEGRFDNLTLEPAILRKGLSDRARNEYFHEEGNGRYRCLEWEVFTDMASYLTCCRYKQADFVDEIEKELDGRNVVLSEAPSYDGNADDYDDDNDLDNGTEGNHHYEVSPELLGTGDIDRASDSGFRAPPRPRPIYPSLWTFTEPCTQEATTASDTRDRRCYACYYNYGIAFSHAEQTEPAVRTPCGHIHGIVCLENHFKTGKATCPLCRAKFFKFEQRLSPEASDAYNRLVQAIDGIAHVDGAIDRYLFEGQKEVHDFDFAELLGELIKLCTTISDARSDLRNQVEAHSWR
jgi:hypothetical protein